MDKADINVLREKYPKYISLEQFRLICHCSKRTAKSLLDSGLVPNVDTGKVTHRYRIHIEDVIKYLRDRERRPNHYKVYHPKMNCNTAEITLPEITDDNRYIFRNNLESLLTSSDDVVSCKEISRLLGYSKETPSNWYRRSLIKGFIINGKLLFPKEYLIDFLVSDYAVALCHQSVKHRNLLIEATKSL